MSFEMFNLVPQQGYRMVSLFVPRRQIRARQVRARALSLLTAASALAVSLSQATDALGVNTTFTNATGNLLWGDPGNWSSGLPSQFDTAVFAAPSAGPIDLGGVVRQTGFVRFSGNEYQLTNGSLLTSNVTALATTATISANLTAPSTGQLTLVGDGLTVSGTIYGSIDVQASGVLTGANTYTGKTSLFGGAVTLDNVGSAASSSQWSMTTGTLTLNYGAAGNVNKIGDGAPLSMWRGNVLFNNASNAAVNEALGTLTISRSANVIKLSTTNASAGTMTVSHPNFIRDNFASALLDVNPAEGTFLKPTPSSTPPAPLVQNVIYGWLMGLQRSTPGAVDGPLSFITFSDSRGLRPLDLATEYAPTIDGSQSDTRLTDTQSLTATRIVHSLAMHGASAGVTFDNNAELRISQGALALSAGASDPLDLTVMSGNGRLTTLANELTVWTDAYAPNTRRYRIDVPMNVTPLTKSGPGTLVLSKPNTMNGAIRINDGTLASAAQGAMGAVNTPLILRQGSLAFESVPQGIGTLTMDAYNIIDGSSVFISTANVSVESGITATIEHVAGTGRIGKIGGGRLRIAGDSAPAGASIDVLAGSLQIDGTYQNVPLQLPGDGAISQVFSVSGIGTNYVLGNGTIIGSAQISVAPGVDAPGRLTVGTLSTSLEPTALAIELAGTTPASGYDQLVTTNAARLQNRSLAVDLLNNFDPALGDQFLVLDNRSATAINGTFTGLPQDSVFFADGQAFQINYLGGDGNDVVLTAVVPEPSTFSFAIIASLIPPMLGRSGRAYRARRARRSDPRTPGSGSSSFPGGVQ